MATKWPTPAVMNSAAKVRLPTRYQSFRRFAISTVSNSGPFLGRFRRWSRPTHPTSRQERSKPGRSTRTRSPESARPASSAGSSNLSENALKSWILPGLHPVSDSYQVDPKGAWYNWLSSTATEKGNAGPVASEPARATT